MDSVTFQERISRATRSCCVFTRTTNRRSRGPVNNRSPRFGKWWRRRNGTPGRVSATWVAPRPWIITWRNWKKYECPSWLLRNRTRLCSRDSSFDAGCVCVSNKTSVTLQIVETMSYTDNVATFLGSLDSFYESVPTEDLELLVGPVLERMRSQPGSPLSGSPLGSLFFLFLRYKMSFCILIINQLESTILSKLQPPYLCLTRARWCCYPSYRHW